MSLASAPTQLLPTGPSPVDIQLGRIDGDGFVDLAALGADGRVTVALNHGTNHWRSAQTYNLGAGPANGMALGRFDADPFLDLVLQGPNSLTLARGDGTGRFTAAQTITPGSAGTLAPPGGGRVGLAATLLNDDFFTDLATVAPGSNEVLVFRGSGSGTLGTPARYASGASQPVAVAAGNFIGDALPDLAVGHRDGTITFLEGRAAGQLVLRPELSVTGLGSVAALTAGDFDSDGDLDLAVSGTDRVTVLLNADDGLTASPIVNGDFSAGLTGWRVTGGSVSAAGGFAQFREGASFLATLQQTFVVPANPRQLSFDLVSLGLEAPAGGVPDAFEASLLDAGNSSLVPTIRPQATSFFNANPGGSFAAAPGVTFDGRRVTVDISRLAPGTRATLVFDLVGNPPGSTSVAAVDDVRISPDTSYAESFTRVALPGPFGATAGVAAGDMDGDGRLDLVVADGGRGRLIVYNGSGTGGFVRTEQDLAPFGSGASAVAAGPLTTGDAIDDVALTLAGSNRALTPLRFDATSPTVTVLDPAPGQVVNRNVRQIRIRFSEAVRDAGPAANNSVTNPASYLLFSDGGNNRFDGGGGDDVPIPIVSVAYDPLTFEATLVIAGGSAPLPDERYQLVIKGNDPSQAIQDLAGNRLGGGVDATATFTVDTTPPTATITLTPNILWPPNHRLEDIEARLTVSDAVTSSPTVVLLSITSNEPDDGLGDGDTVSDIQDAAYGTDDRRFRLRAERSGTGSGRVYTVTYLVRDAAGNGRVVSAAAVVPHDQGSGQALLATIGDPTPRGLGRLQGVPSRINHLAFTVGSVVADAITAPREVDVWAFNAAAGQRLFFDAQSGAASTFHWFLTGPQGNVLFSDMFQDQPTLVLGTAGSYRLTLEAPSGQTGSYRFQVWNAPNPAAVPAAVGQAVSGTIAVPGETDRYTFSGTAGQRLFFDVQDNPGARLVFTLLRPDGAVLFGPRAQDRDVFALPAAGTYTVAVAGRAGSLDATGAYRFQLWNVPADAPRAIALDTPVAGTLTVPGQTATYTFSGRLGQQVLFDVLGTLASGLSFTLRDPAGGTVFADQTDDRLVPSLPVSGTYTLVADAAEDRVGSLSFQVADRSAPPPPPPATANNNPTNSLPNPRVGTRSVGPIDFARLQDVTPLGRLDYRGTTYNRQTHTLHADVRLTNTSGLALDRPVVAVFDRFTPPAVSLANPDGLHPSSGRPFLAFVAEISPTGLLSGQTSSAIPLEFGNPTEVRFAFDVSLLARGTNAAPSFTSTPVTTAPVGQPYVYAPTVTDPDGDPLTFRLAVGPEGMAIDAATGRVTWTPVAGQAGTHTVTLTVSDGRGGTATQSYVVSTQGGATGPGSGNRRPVIVSEPVTRLAATEFLAGTLSDTVFTVPGTPGQPVTARFRWTVREAVFDNEFGIYRVSNQQGRVGNLLPGNPGYAQAALSAGNSQVIFRSGLGAGAETDVTLQPGEFLGFYLIQNGTTASFLANNPQNLLDRSPLAFFSFPDANPDDRFDHLRATVMTPEGLTQFGWEDLTFGGDQDFNDVVFTIDLLLLPGARGTYRYPVRAVDPDGDALTYSLPVAPAGAAINPLTGEVTWIAAPGQHAFTVRVEDGRGGFDSQSFVLEVTDAAPGQVRGTKFNDVNRNAVRDASEPGLAGWTVYLDQNRNGQRDGGELFTTTDAGGNYSFSLPAGTYLVAEQGQPGWEPTAPTGGFYLVTLASGQVVAGRDFGSSNTADPAVNRLPVFTSVAPTSAVVGQLFRYNASASDRDGDSLTFDLPVRPAGMAVHSSAGVVVWVPAADQVGSHPVVLRVQDGRGGVAQQSFTVTVTSVSQAPVITSMPPLVATAGQRYDYLVTASDPNGDTVRFELPAGPAGMTINASTGQLTWTPAAADHGTRRVTVRAVDPAGNAGLQSYDLEVRGPNTAPVVTSTPITQVTAGTVYRYGVQASDTEDPFTFRLVTGPAGMTIDARTGLILWSPTAAHVGSHAVTVRVTDERGASTDQTFTLAVVPDTERPSVSLLFSANIVQPGQPVTFQVVAADNVGIATRSLTVNGSPLPLDGAGRATFTPSGPGLFSLVATATDNSGNTSAATFRLRVLDPSDTQAPFVQITSPRYGDVVTYVTNIVGTVTDPNLEFYRVERARVGTDQWVTLAEGTSPVVNGLLGKFDPTLLDNDDYLIRVVAQDVSGNIFISPEILVGVTAGAKLGHFRLEFTDLSIPVAGIPIQVSRVYDTRQADQSGDFGFGWRLGVRDARIRETLPVNPLEQVASLFVATPFRAGTRVYLTNPEGRRVGFTFDPVPEGAAFGTLWRPRFRPDPGVFDKLEVDDIPLFQRGDGTFGLYLFGFAYNPDEYRLTTKDGVAYRYNQFTGLQNITDRNGNILTYRDDGVFSSTGQSIRFVRDALGRITEIIDPAGNAIRYRYDANGDLVSMTDQAGLVSSYTYLVQPSHYLDKVIDPLGRPAVRTTYDAQGRLIADTDALGNAVRQSYDLDNFTETVTDPLGNVTRLVYDARGNIASATNPLGARTSFRYDSNDNMIAHTDPRGFTTTMAYDARGNVTTITDPLGQTHRFTYTAFDQVQTATDPLGRTVRYIYDSRANLIQLINAAGTSSFTSYDSSGRPISRTDNNGNTTRYIYSGGPLPTQIIHPDGTSRHLAYNSLGEVTRLVNENGNEETLVYDSSGRLLSTRDADGNETVLAYEGHRLVSVTNPLRRVTRYEYDDAGRRVREINPLGGVTQFVYDGNNQLIAQTDTLGRTTRYTYRADGRLASVTRNPTTSYEYDATGNLTAIIDANGHRTTYEYDALNRLIRHTDALGGVRLFVYDAVGNHISSRDENGNTTQYAYDDLNHLIRETDALGGIRSHSYDQQGNRTTFTDARGRTTRYVYDARQQLIQQIDPAGGVIRYGYDPAGNRVSLTDELGQTTTYAYDSLNRLMATTDPLGGRTSYGYDAGGNRTSAMDPLNRRTSYAYDDLGRLISVTDPSGSVTRYTYDLVGNRTSVTDTLGQTTRFTYDALDQLVQQTDPFGRTQLFAYDPVGNQIQTTDRNGRVRRFAYDALDRQVRETWWDGGNLVRTISFTYDAVDNLLSASDPDSTYTLTYDALGRATSVDNAGTPGVPRTVLFYRYDAVGNVLSVNDNLSVRVDSTYDERDLLVRRTWQGPGIDPARVDFSYNARSERTGLQRFSDLAGTRRVGRSEARYDAAGHLTDLTHRNAVDAVLADYDYLFDLTGRLVREVHHGQTADYRYDLAGQLTEANRSALPNESYAYDANGNRTGGGYVIGPNNQILSDGTFNYVYDAEGNLIRKTETATGVHTTYAYDHRNRLTRLEVRNAAGSLIGQASFTYDVIDRRIAKVVNGEAIYYVYDDNHVWADFNAAGSATARYLFGNHIDEVLARYRPGEGTAWYLSDRQGTVRDIANAVGLVVSHLDYDSFGNLLGETNPGVADRYRFTGREYDAETGLYYYRARYYDPRLGRFISQDPLGFEAGDTNLYRYVHNSPLNATDPSGLAAVLTVYGRQISYAEVAILVGGTLILGGTIVMSDLAIYTRVTTSGPSPLTRFIEAVYLDATLKIELLRQAARAKDTSEVRVRVRTETGEGEGRLRRKPYRDLIDPPTVGPDKDFTKAQKSKIIEQNRLNNRNGSVLSDATGKVLKRPLKSLIGVTPDPCEWQIDHHEPKKPNDPRSPKGTNSYCNARVLSRAENRQKSNR